MCILDIKLLTDFFIFSDKSLNLALKGKFQDTQRNYPFQDWSYTERYSMALCKLLRALAVSTSDRPSES